MPAVVASGTVSVTVPVGQYWGKSPDVYDKLRENDRVLLTARVVEQHFQNEPLFIYSAFSRPSGTSVSVVVCEIDRHRNHTSSVQVLVDWAVIAS